MWISLRIERWERKNWRVFAVGLVLSGIGQCLGGAVSDKAAASALGWVEVVGLFVMIAGLVIALRARAARERKAARRARPAASDPRWNRGATPAQLVGRLCALCQRKITVAGEAARCKACDAIVHEGCADEHRVGAHGPGAATPYRA